MWVGNSMLFNWLDRNLEQHPDQSRLSMGKIFMIHSGAFYDVEKKLLAPGEMPAILHIFKWQNGLTWISGICLLVLVYFTNGAAFLVDPSVHDIDPTVAITLAVSALFCGWLIYDAIWRVWGERFPNQATGMTIALLAGAIFGFCQVFSGRGAYIMTGVLIGTLMTGNVWLVIMPSQQELISATTEGREQDPIYSKRAKHRSIHNNYLTFPLLFMMLSNHFTAATSHFLNWLILMVVIVGGAGVRYFMNLRYRGNGIQLKKIVWLPPAFASAALAMAALVIVPHIARPGVIEIDHPVAFARVQEIIGARCLPCHSKHPSDDMFHSPPVGVMFDTPQQVKLMAPRIKVRATELKNMPFNNKTGITEQERAELARWISDGSRID